MKLLKIVEDVCKRDSEVSNSPLIWRNIEKIICPCGRKVEKTSPNEAFYMKVIGIHVAMSFCSNVECLIYRSNSNQIIVVQRIVVAKPNNNDKLAPKDFCPKTTSKLLLVEASYYIEN